MFVGLWRLHVLDIGLSTYQKGSNKIGFDDHNNADYGQIFIRRHKLSSDIIHDIPCRRTAVKA